MHREHTELLKGHVVLFYGTHAVMFKPFKKERKECLNIEITLTKYFTWFIKDVKLKSNTIQGQRFM